MKQKASAHPDDSPILRGYTYTDVPIVYVLQKYTF